MDVTAGSEIIIWPRLSVSFQLGKPQEYKGFGQGGHCKSFRFTWLDLIKSPLYTEEPDGKQYQIQKKRRIRS